MDASVPPIPCTNAWDGTGCGADVCTLVATSSVAECLPPPANPKGFEQGCDQSAHDCHAGQSCVLISGESPPPRCRKICRPGMDGDCAGLVGTGTQGYACLLLIGGRYGMCIPKPRACEPFADTCPSGQVCTLFPVGETGCEPAGTAGLGQSCAQTACARGGVCVDLGAGPHCAIPCDPANPSCAGNSVCTGLISNVTNQPLSFGYCQSFAPCDPINDTCHAGDTCGLLAPGVTGCVPSSTATAGHACLGSPPSCARGDLCVDFGSGPSCYVLCNQARPCVSGSCFNLTRVTFGVCR
jgi:hypothetical protein